MILNRRQPTLEEVQAMGGEPRKRFGKIGVSPQAPPVPEALFVHGQLGWGPSWRLGSLRLQWDGEIYDRGVLCALLDAPHDTPDPLLVLHGWQKEGALLLERINGPFALALADLDSGGWLLARGSQGLRPLFWYCSPDGIAFARDLPALFRCAWVSREPYWEKIPEYLVFDHVAGGETLYRSVRELLPGERLSGSLGGTKTSLERPSVLLPAPRKNLEGPEVMRGTEDALRTAAARLYAVGPRNAWGFFLSGGVDSSLLALVLQELAEEAEFPCLTVTCPGFRYDEGPFARDVRDRLGLAGAEIPLNPQAFASHWIDAVEALLTPLTSTNQVPWWILCREARKRGWSAVFSGEGADGWLSGALYDEEQEALERLWDVNREEVAFRMIFCRTHCLNPPALVQGIMAVPLDVKGRRAIWEEIRSQAQSASPAEMGVLYHVRTTGHRLLTRADLVAGHHGIPLRLPYLERGWLQWALSLPYSVRNANGVRKHPLKSLAAREWGDAFAHRKKIGFPFPLRGWIQRGQAPQLEAWGRMLLDEKTLGRGLYRREALEREVRRRIEGDKRPLDWLLWSLINVELWLRSLEDRP